MRPDDQDPSAPVNSRAWWEQNFRHDWDGNHGSAQTAHFMDRLVAGLTGLDREFRYLSTHPLEVLDWGCAFGQGAQRLAEAFPSCRVTGLDFAEEAVKTARLRYPALEFLHTEGGPLPRDFDVIVTSNCLEHFEDPLAIARNHLRSCRKLYVALVPYREGPVLLDCHAVRFDDDTFPLRLGGFLRVAAKTIQVDPAFWDGQQLLVVYASPGYLAEADIVGGAAAPTDRAAWAMRVEELHVERDLQTKAHAAREAELIVRLDERERVIEELNARHDELSTSFAELSTRHAELSTWHAELTTWHARDREQDRLDREGFQERILVLQRAVDELAAWSRVQGAQLAEIASSRSWKLVQFLSRIRQEVASPGSLAARVGRFGLRAVQKLVREGLVPFVRAVFRRLTGRVQVPGPDESCPAAKPAATLDLPDRASAA